MSVPQSSVTRLPPKLATQTLSLPSTAIPHGILSPPPVNGLGLGTPLLAIMLTE